eukprot:359650-Chlamydomonas_euryale.AAC.13
MPTFPAWMVVCVIVCARHDFVFLAPPTAAPPCLIPEPDPRMRPILCTAATHAGAAATMAPRYTLYCTVWNSRLHQNSCYDLSHKPPRPRPPRTSPACPQVRLAALVASFNALRETNEEQAREVASLAADKRKLEGERRDLKAKAVELTSLLASVQVGQGL